MKAHIKRVGSHAGSSVGGRTALAALPAKGGRRLSCARGRGRLTLALRAVGAQLGRSWGLAAERPGSKPPQGGSRLRRAAGGSHAAIGCSRILV